MAHHPSVSSILQFFAYAHLPPHLADVSKDFAVLAARIASDSQNSETTVALRKLLEAKDAAVRAVLYAEPSSVDSNARALAEIKVDIEHLRDELGPVAKLEPQPSV